MRRNLNRADRRNERLARENRRLERQRNWERARRRERRVYDYFRFTERAEIVRESDNRAIYAGLAGLAVGAAAGSLFVYGNDDYRVSRGADIIEVDPYDNGWTRTVVERPNGVQVVTVRDANGLVVRRERIFPGGESAVLYNNQPTWWDEEDVYVDVAPPVVDIPQERYVVQPSTASVQTVYETVTAPPVADLDRTYTLNQILLSEALRQYMPRIDLDEITFDLGSAEVPVEQIDALETIGVAIEEAVADDPSEIYLIEGHTDATGSDITNLELSDQRAASVADILTTYFEIPPENLVTQGYGEQHLKVPSAGEERANRRVAIRRITPLLSREDSDIALSEELEPTLQ